MSTRLMAILCVVAGFGLAEARPAGVPAQLRVLPEVQELIRAGIPVGVVLGLDDDQPTPSATREEGGVRRDRGATADAFARRWAGVFTVTDSGQMVQAFSPRASRCQAGLSRRVSPARHHGRPYEVLFSIAKGFDRSLESLPPPGIFSSRLSSGSAETPGAETSAVADGLLREVRVLVQEGTLRAALDNLASASGLGWLARETCDEKSGECRCQLGLLTGTSVSWTSYDATAGLGQGQAYGNPRVFAIALAQNDVPAGMVVPEEYMTGGKGMPHAEITVASKAAFRNDLVPRLELFNASGETFRASQGTSGVVHLRSRQEPPEVTEALERRSGVEPALGLTALGAVFGRGVAALRGFPPQGLMGSAPGTSPEPECPMDRELGVAGGSMTATSLLDHIVLQVPGLVWLVTYRQVPGASLQMNLGLLCANGRYVTITVFP